jgi:4'-phosphopantetheinyl transferase
MMDEVILRMGPHGKPVCTHPDAPAFNLSHATNTVAVVFSPQGPVGTDIESMHRSPTNPWAVAKKVFTEQERRELESGERDFLSLWTRKEAVLKAMGSGFTAGAGQLQTEQVAGSFGWRLEEFREKSIRGAVCLPESVPLVFR